MFCMFAAAALAGGDGVLKVSDLGYDPADSTRYIRKALESGAKKIVLDRQSGPWYTLPLKMRSNTELVLEPGVELVAKRGAFRDIRDYLLELPHVTNVVVRGGEGSTLRMWKKDYQGPDYKHGEWRYALRIFHSENVLVEGLTIVESGGDGIGVTGKDIVIRDCVMDRNHRQGISVFSAENLLIENCVLSNTGGTPPQAGIDFEPDRPAERLINVTMRNCLSVNNNGRGFEFFLGRLNSSSRPVSITLENCRAVGNSESAWVNGGGAPNPVKGFVRFRNCVFESARDRGVSVFGAPAHAFDVEFIDTVVSNAAPGQVSPDVAVSPGSTAQGPCDGIRFDGLTVFQPVDRPWHLGGIPAFGAPPSRFGGTVTVVKPDGRRELSVLDADWVKRYHVSINDGRPLPPRVSLPSADRVKVSDSAPGRSVRLSPVTLLYGARYIFYASAPGRCNFSGRKVSVVKGRKLDLRPMTVTPVGHGDAGEKWTVPAIRDRSCPFSFDAPRAGFYRIDIPSNGYRFLLETSDVPVGIDVTEKERITASLGCSPFSLWFPVHGNDPFSFLASGGSIYRFKAALASPDGRTALSDDEVDGAFLFNSSARPAAGLWRVDFARAQKPLYDWIRLDMFGSPGCLFLSEKKIWTVKQEGTK